MPRPRPRVVWAAVVTTLLGLLFTATTTLTIAAWAGNTEGAATNPVVDVAFFALGGVLITGGFAAQIRGRHPAGLQQAILALLALSGAGLVAGRIEPFIGGLVLLAAAVPLVGLVPGDLLARGEGLSRALTVLGLAALIPAFAYAGSMLALARTSGPSCFLGQCAQGDRFAETAALAVAVPLVTLIAARRTTGWLLSAWCAGTAATLVGLTSLLLPLEAGAPAAPWAVLAALWGVALIAVALRQRRSGPADRQSSTHRRHLVPTRT